MLLNNITGIKKITTLSALTDIRTSSLILSSNDYFVASILSGEGDSGLFPSGYASVKVSFDTLRESIFSNSITPATSGTFTSNGYVKVVIAGQNKYIRLYDLT
jgi:hypothetical protein